MPETKNAMPSSGSRSCGERFDGDGAARSSTFTNSTGAIVMKSVSMFLARSRKASVSPKRQELVPADQKQEIVVKRKRRKSRVNANMKSVTYYAKIIESLKKKTKFSKYGNFFLIEPRHKKRTPRII